MILILIHTNPQTFLFVKVLQFCFCFFQNLAFLLFVFNSLSRIMQKCEAFQKLSRDLVGISLNLVDLSYNGSSILGFLQTKSCNSFVKCWYRISLALMFPQTRSIQLCLERSILKCDVYKVFPEDAIVWVTLQRSKLWVFHFHQKVRCGACRQRWRGPWVAACSGRLMRLW